MDDRDTDKPQEMIRPRLTDEQKDRIRLLVDALRSGQYQRAQGVLRDKYNNSYCCLGVACAVYQEKSGKASEWFSPSGSKQYFKTQMGNSWSDLPRDVQDWYGFIHSNPTLLESGPNRTATNINDAITDDGQIVYTFAQIADMFEAYYLGDGPGGK